MDTYCHVLGGYNLFKVIYSFHMPTFFFINGWLAPRNYAPKRTVFKLVYPYIIFQILYQLFCTYVINDEDVGFSVQFGTPYWLLWYLLSLTFYYLLIPVISTNNRKYAGIFLVGTIILSIAIGFDPSIGYYMSLSRTVVFLPYFVFGYYVGHDVFKVNHAIEKVRNNKIMMVLNFVLTFLVFVVMYKQDLNRGALFGALPYDQSGILWYIRLEMIIVAFVWIWIFMAIVPDREIVGKLDTFPIYVMHGFIILLLKKHNPFSYSFSVNLLLAALISVSVMIVFGNKYVSQTIKFFLRGEWAVNLFSRLLVSSKRTEGI